MRLCRFSAHLGLWWGKFTDAVPDDSQSLNPSAADSHRLKHLNTFHKFSDDFCIQLLYVRVLAHKSNKAVYIYAVLLLNCNATAKFYGASFQRFLLRLIVFGHLGKTLVRYLALNIILVKPLNDDVEFVYGKPCGRLTFYGKQKPLHHSSARYGHGAERRRVGRQGKKLLLYGGGRVILILYCYCR